MIEIKNIDYQYRKNANKVFSNLSLNIPEGKVCGLLGKNGAGKSTLLYLISGLLTTKTGSITMNGQDVSKRQAEVLSNLFLVPEEFELPAISISEYVNAMAPFYPKFDRVLMEECLSHFELPAEINLGQLSMGQKKKVFMCFALATNVQYLLMDEPTNGMDIPSKSQFRKVISRCMTDDRTILISTHQVKDVELLLDQIIIIDNSNVLLNEEAFRITQKLAFKLMSQSQVPDDALFSMPSVMGQAVVVPNRDDEDTDMDLELLFNTVISNPEKIKLLFNC